MANYPISVLTRLYIDHRPPGDALVNIRERLGLNPVEVKGDKRLYPLDQLWDMVEEYNKKCNKQNKRRPLPLDRLTAENLDNLVQGLGQQPSK